MNFIKRIFRGKTPYVSKVDVLAKMSWMTTLEECKDVSGMINNLTLKVNKQPLRDELCDKTFKIFIGQYGSKSI